MKYIPLIVTVAFFCIVGYITSGIVNMFKNTQMRYNCEIAEISPDFPAQAKQECRELRIKNEQRTIQGDSTSGGR